MKYLLIRSYCLAHMVLRRVFKSLTGEPPLYSFPIREKDTQDGDAENGHVMSLYYPVENYFNSQPNIYWKKTFVQRNFKRHSKFIGLSEKTEEAWLDFLRNSHIPRGFKNEGFHFGGYLGSGYEEWCLPSWIWTSARMVSTNFLLGHDERALVLCNKFLSTQQSDGSWIVRDDYIEGKPSGIKAPNDSAYIANHALLTGYLKTGKEVYLESAIRCADWIMSITRNDGLVSTGFDTQNQKWLNDFIIVDTGFTLGLFAKIYEITQSEKYREYLIRFTESFVKYFLKNNGFFSTSIDSAYRHVGGSFARGQAWALEGLIASYRVNSNPSVFNVIKKCINVILREQHRSGGWSYNFERKLLGDDGKAVPVISRVLMDYYDISKDENVLFCVKKAMNWCARHTRKTGAGRGGIFTFSMEGGVVHHNYSSMAFVYSSSYALEVSYLLKEIQNGK